MCLFHVSLQIWSGSDRVLAHDEFTGARKVSSLDRAMRMSGFIRLRRTAAPGAICALSLIAAASPRAADDATPWDGTAHGRRGGGGKTGPRRRRDQTQERLAPLLALSRRRRRAAALRLYGIAERQDRRRAVARAAAHPGTRPGHDWIYRRRHPA